MYNALNSRNSFIEEMTIFIEFIKKKHNLKNFYLFY